MKIFLGTIALEVNRWSSRVPSFSVCDWIDKIRNDGFDGIELWENHLLMHEKPEEEAKRILASGFPVEVYNSYIGFENSAASHRDTAVKMIKLLKAPAVKYNVGSDLNKLVEYKDNLIKFASDLPESCRLLCELHDGTVLEDDAVAMEFFNDLPKGKFDLILQPFGSLDVFKKKFEIFGDRITNIHSQLSDDNDKRIGLEQKKNTVCECFAVMKDYDFDGDITIEFTEGTASPGENIDDLYKNTVLDMQFIRDHYIKNYVVNL